MRPLGANKLLQRGCSTCHLNVVVMSWNQKCGRSTRSESWSFCKLIRGGGNASTRVHRKQVLYEHRLPACSCVAEARRGLSVPNWTLHLRAWALEISIQRQRKSNPVFGYATNVGFRALSNRRLILSESRYLR